MSKVIEIENRLELEKRKKKEAERRRNLAPLLHFLQCVCCRMKCWRCGSQVDVAAQPEPDSRIPFSLCKSCHEEYSAYEGTQVDGETDPKLWHNQEWKLMWEKWIEYQQAIRNFQQSEEIRELFRES